MSKRSLILLLLAAVLGCQHNDDPEPTERWIVTDLHLQGDAPLPNADGSYLAYHCELPQAILKVVQLDNDAELISIAAPVNTDYSWDHSGSKIAYSFPDGRCYVSRIPLSPVTVSMAGFHPRFLNGDSLVVYSGPEDNSQHQGIFIFNLESEERIQINDSGTAPEVSPDGQKIAYLLPVAGTPGRMLVVYHRQTYFTQPLASNVYNFDWLNDSETIVFETLRAGVQTIGLVSFDEPQQNYGPGTLPAGLPDEFAFVYSAVIADTIAGVMLGVPHDTPVKIADQGIQLAAAGHRRLFAQGQSSLITIHPE